jgi:DNA-binding NarL/FixJ family response regulator
VIAEAGDITELEREVREALPDVVVVDPYSSAMKGIESLHCIFSLVPNVRLIIYTSSTERAHVVTALELGVKSYLLKHDNLDRLLQDLRQACSGITIVASDAARTLVEHIQHKGNRKENDKDSSLSAREFQVLEKLALGMNNRNIADALSICEATVKYHVHAILEKLGVSNRTEAVTVALERKIIELRQAI